MSGRKSGYSGCVNPVAKALWFIETHFGQEITLDDVSSVGEVSRFHLSRAFGPATGLSIMRYVRGRRLTGAARTLSQGPPIFSPSPLRPDTVLTKRSPARFAISLE